MNIFDIAKQNQEKAWQVIKNTNIIQIWEDAGAKINLVYFYTSFVIYSKSALYKIHIAFKEQIRNKTVFFYNSVFFSFHLISFFALGNI